MLNPKRVNDVSLGCTEISGIISFIGDKLHVKYSGTIEKKYIELLYFTIQKKVSRLYKENYQKLTKKNETLCFYFITSHKSLNIEIQCFLKQNAVRLYLYSSLKTLPFFFKQIEKDQEKKENQRIRDLLEEGIIQNDIISLYYQPIIKINNKGAVKAIKGAEAFLRVKDNGILCNPKKYLDVAEADPILMRKLGYKILELACSDLMIFKKKYPMFTVSLNVSEKQFARFEDSISFESIFTTIKEQYNIERHDIALEVPEVTADINTDNSALLKRLFDEGTPIILDDFTLGAIMKNPIVEIDKYKVSGQMLHDSSNGNERQKYIAQDFLKRVFNAAREYNKSVVVKGLEEYSQIPVLLNLGFSPELDLIQGNLFCPPMDLNSFEFIYKENVIRLYKSHMVELLKHANIRVLFQKNQILQDICNYFSEMKFSEKISVANSFSELWSTEDRNLVVIMGYDFISHIVSKDQIKDIGNADQIWEDLLIKGSLFEIPGLSMALINNFQDIDQIEEIFEMVEEYDGHNLYQILITINKEKTKKIPFIILSDTNTEMQHLEENVIILNKLESLDNFEEAFVQSISNRPETISKFNRF